MGPSIQLGNCALRCLNNINSMTLKNQQNDKPKSKKTNNQKRIKMLSKTASTGNRSQKPISINKGTNVGNPAFFQALTDPFNPDSLGCQVPDPFPFPTETFHVHQTTVLGCVGATTDVGMMFLPNPVVSMVDLTRINTASLGVKAVQSTPMTPFSNSTSNPSGGIYGAVTQAAVSTIFSTWRVVSWGIKISNLQPQLNATGRFFVSYFPCGDTMPTPLDISLANTAGIVSPMVGINSVALESSVILETPTAFEFTVGDLMRGDIQLSGMYTNSNFWTFKSSLGAGDAGTRVVGDEVSVTSSGVASGSYKDLSRCNGGCAIVLYAEGLPAGVLANIQIETIYHLEGTPQFASASNSMLVPSVGRKANVGTQNNVDIAMISSSLLKNSVKFLKEGAQFLNDHGKDVIAGAKVASMLLL